LNSVLLEGIVVGRNEEVVMIESKRYEKEMIVHTVVVPVFVSNKEWKERMKDGQKIRIVGHLIKYDDGIAVVAEHVEWDPSS
jgi:hypothetical protein